MNAERLGGLAAFLADPLVASLVQAHPNRVAEPGFTPPAAWLDWWDVDAARTVDWLSLLNHYQRDLACPSIPPSLRSVITSARRLQLPRDPHPDSIQTTQRPAVYGMSPKKGHEVARMVDYIAHLLSSTPALARVSHVVDVGAGQGYLSRALRDSLGLHVLAIDGDDRQTQGAERRAEKIAAKSRNAKTSSPHPSSSGSLTHKTIRINPDTLRSAVSEWTSEHEHKHSEPVQVLVVALHACGSLTPDILRGVLASRGGEQRWTPAAALVVGCCYNLMSENDFPLSKRLAAHPSRPRMELYRRHDHTRPDHSYDSTDNNHELVLTQHHVQLAAQVPSQWTRTPATLRAAELAMNKVVWRALLGRWVGLREGREGQSERRGLVTGRAEVECACDRDTGESVSAPRPQVRLGKLPASAYTSFPAFLRSASAKAGVSLPPDAYAYLDTREGKEMEGRLRCLYVMRCLLGPAVESLLLLDRVVWLREGLEEAGDRREAGMVSLFDQGTGSARNVAIVVAPRSDFALLRFAQ
ncbi:hypothetical protein GLOTRDRAFT_116519 [Gloeophyllum trabeum ATCC 11539]|uniref:Methyltransferase domain-containing protein n=1 Tax=Gloeophyllum trabeum (strain ATCC 11539 / FP-39264 / Madison 617) TaxID=670483 RepID=S7Q3Y1_GLOTA|nr:uncharacterized protein GLOTRDRAFT_116519 [Gloeophyllum trabeum ATCC 11539]EPQ54716.1 hypothetical protein GLOTRDRAFT_116519 [Gloeophyllum trabeum ATCC 11539]